MDSKQPTSGNEDDKTEVETKQEHIRQIAVSHAQDIERKKSTQNKVLDLILDAYDLPSKKDVDPATPITADLVRFRECLSFFRPSDLDELVDERNIDDRCGYALCGKALDKQPAAGKVWSNKLGRLIERKAPNQFCSHECGVRNTFVRNQLSTEPAWTRVEKPQEIRILDVTSVTPSGKSQDTGASSETDQTTPDKHDPVQHTIGEDVIRIVEKESDMNTQPPSLTAVEVLEGLPIRGRR